MVGLAALGTQYEEPRDLQRDAGNVFVAKFQLPRAERIFDGFVRCPAPESDVGCSGYALQIVLRLQNSRMPAAASSRPYPESLIPPNGSSG